MDGTTRSAWIKRLIGLGALGAVLLALAAGSSPGRTEDVLPPGLAAADKLYEEKSYAAALKAYDQLLTTNQVPETRRDEVGYRRVVSMGKAKQWDQALADGLEFVRTHRGTVWEPRGLYWLGRLYLAVPHGGYRVKLEAAPTKKQAPGAEFRIYRGDDVPKLAGNAQPERVELAEQDYRNAQDALEAARVYFPTYRTASHTEAEEIQLNFDLVRLLQQGGDLHLWASQQKWSPPSAPEWKIDPTARYSPDWAPPKRIAYLYEQIRMLAGKDPHTAVLALFGKALWFQNYHAVMNNYAQRWEEGKQIRIPYPYEEEKAEEPLRRLIREYPNDPLREQAQFTLGNFLRTRGAVEEALAEYRRLVRERPESKWAQDAGAAIQGIIRREISLSPNGGEQASRKPTFQLSYRNVERVRFTIYRLDLDDAFQQKFVGDNWFGFQQLLGDLKSARKLYGPQVASWSVSTKRVKPYQGGSQPVQPPVDKIGAYVLEARTEGVRIATLFTVTDLGLVQKISREEVHFFAAQLQSGAPEAGVTVLAQQWWWNGNQRERRTVTGTTDARGLVTLPLPQGPNRYNITTAAVAWKEDRYALTRPASSYQVGDNNGAVKVYSQTDRAVYRPRQTVSYRQVVLRRGTHEQPGDLKPLAGKKVEIAIYDPRGSRIHQQQALTGEFGSISGEFILPEGAPLGEYGMNVTLPDQANTPLVAGGNRFRVEEYKKPEFEVTVEPAAERVRLGEKTTAKLTASYYFGGPVPNARVSYRVYRTYYQQSYRFPRPYDFLYGADNSGDYQMDFHQGEVVTQGEARTDAQGEAKIEFSTDAKGSRWGDNDLSYTVEADVQDASRRVITGTGSVKATKHDVAVFLDFPRGYATKGDEVKVEILTLNPSNKPVAVSGSARVIAYAETPDAKERMVHEEPLKTDTYGRAYLRWTANTGGRYRVEFVTRDTAEQEVKGATDVWVQGPELAQGRFQYRQVFLKLKELYYEESQQAKALLVTPGNGCTVLLTREVDNQILEKQVVTVPGRSLELTLPITRRDVPNVHLTAILIRDAQMFSAQEELFVPSKRQFITVSVEADKAQYQPGEKASLKLVAKDWQGKPLRTELSVAVTDASLDYIQKGYSPDVRVFFYGERRPNAVQSSGSTDTYFQPTTEDTQPRKQFKTHQWTMPEGMGQIADWPGEAQFQPYNWYYQGYRYRGLALGMPMGGTRWNRYDVAMEGVDFAREMQAKPAAAPMSAAQMAGGGTFGRSAGVLNRRNPFEPNFELSKMKAGAADALGNLADAETRTTFADTAFWTPAVVTGADGAATVQVTWPDNLTEWHASAVGVTAGAQVGAGETDVRTKKDLLVRLQAPRFFVERDRVLLTANVHNYLPQDARVQVKLDLGGDAVELMPSLADATGGAGLSLPSAPAESWIDVPKDGEKRVDWSIRVQREGMLKVKMTARSQAAADATELSFPVLVHGVERALAQTGVLRDEHGRAQVKVELPAARKPGSSELVLQLNPSLAGVMLDALPYLIDYPYGCIEQTMSRFLPAVVVTKTLKDSGYNLEALQRRALELEEQERKQPRGPDGAQPNSPYTYPKGRPGSLAHIRKLETTRWRSPVFNSVELHQIITEGLARVMRFQRGDGGWGWWPEDNSDPYMTAYVLYGLLLARDAGYQADAGVLDRGLNFLRKQFQEDDNLHRMAFTARVLSLDPNSRTAIRALTTGRLWERRERLSVYSKALLAQALLVLEDREKAETLLRNIETTMKVDAANGTVNWTEADGGWWRWWNNKVETNAAVLHAYLAIRPKSELPGMLVKWLVNNRRGSYWSSTRETAMAVYALADYARVTKELAPEYTATVDLSGRVSRTYSVTRENALFFDNQFVVPDELLETGANTLTLTKEGPGALYFGAYTRYFSLEEPIRATGNEIFVQRRYFRLIPGTAVSPPVAKPLDLSATERRENPFLTGNYLLLTTTGEQSGYEDRSEGPRYERVALKPGDVVTSGEQIEVELQLESKNDYDYLVFEDLKPAGCEPVELRSGQRYGAGLCSNMELRDQKVAFFLTSMPQGTRTLTYRLRAETPGAFHVLPTNGYAMYAPDIRTLSDEMTISVRDGE